MYNNREFLKSLFLYAFKLNFLNSFSFAEIYFLSDFTVNRNYY